MEGSGTNLIGSWRQVADSYEKHEISDLTNGGISWQFSTEYFLLSHVFVLSEILVNIETLMSVTY